jgi:hypothetical protein
MNISPVTFLYNELYGVVNMDYHDPVKKMFQFVSVNFSSGARHVFHLPGISSDRLHKRDLSSAGDFPGAEGRRARIRKSGENRRCCFYLESAAPLFRLYGPAEADKNDADAAAMR